MSILFPLLWWQDGQHSRFSLRQPRLPLCFQCRPTAWGVVNGHAEPRRRAPWYPCHSLATFPTQPNFSLRNDFLPLPPSLCGRHLSPGQERTLTSEEGYRCLLKKGPDLLMVAGELGVSLRGQILTI